MADIKKSVNLLPEYLRTSKNSKFLSSTIDQLIQTPKVERVDGYVGSKLTPNYNPSTDFYIKQASLLRQNYSLEPAAIFNDQAGNVTDVVSYDDLINELSIQGAKTDNLDTLLRSKFYAYDPLIDWDKVVNYTDYYWVPLGPDAITLFDENLDVTDIIGNQSYIMSNGYPLSNGMKIAFFDNTVQAEYRRKEFIVEGVGSSIKLLDFSLLSSYDRISQVFDEEFDSTIFDSYPFDSDRKFPITPDYITINRSSRDLNPWSRYNRWFHKDVIQTTAAINKVPVIFPLEVRARRPIVEFRPNIQLFNFGRVGIRNVDVIDVTTKDAFNEVDGTYGYYVDGVLLQKGHRVIFNADTNNDVRGRIYEVNFDITGPVPVLRLIAPTDNIPTDLDSVGVNFGTDYYGTNWFFESSMNQWKYAQQHDAVNQPPLFDLFTSNGISFTKFPDATNFTGNQIFGYEVGTGVVDEVLGFSLKYKNNIKVGTGSFPFRTYFLTDSISIIRNNQSSSLPTSTTFLKLNDSLVNIWIEAENYQIPIIEVQTLSESTSSLTLTCLDKPINTNIVVTASINDVIIPVTITATQSSVTVNTTDILPAGSTVQLKIETDQMPNSNGFYESPVGLTKNPLNEIISSITLSELGDHLSSMTGKLAGFTGKNLRDLANYTKYGSRLVANANPIVFSQIFLGKKEHNVIDATRQAGVFYDQFKMNFLRLLTTVDDQLSAADALDEVLKTINKARDIKSPYQRSDMLGYGDDKIVRTFTVTSQGNVEYPTGIEFDLTRLSFNSVLVYLNGVQLIANRDYIFDYINGSVTLLTALNIDDIISINYYPNTLGTYIPPTPSKLGLYPAYVPELFTDTSYVTPSLSIRGHDGSITKAYGDYRDAIILEYETRVYNNIKTQYRKEVFDIIGIQPSAFRMSKYGIDDLNNILVNDFSRWSGINSIDASTNTVFDEGNPFTWNYKGSVDNVLDSVVSGYWRSLFKYFYDTDCPNTRPWEMLGYSTRPNWWAVTYGNAPYSSTNTLLWTDLKNGYSRGENAVFSNYVRPDLLSIIPVDSTGNLKSPNLFLVSPNGYQDKIAKWTFGDHSPAETAWRRSSNWPFAINAAAALLDPCGYCSALYDVSRTSINALNQITYQEDDLYLNPKKLLIEGEDNDQVAGFGTYLVEKGKQKDQNYVDALRQDLANLKVSLFHKLGGFASKEKLQIIIDSIDPTSTSPGVVLPPEDYSLILNVSNPIKVARVSGIIVQKSEGKFIIKGYDVANPYFEILRPLKTAISGVVKVGGVSEQFSDWSNVVNNGNKGLSSVDTTSANSTTSRYYKQGQLVRYNSRFYRVKVGHEAQSVFDSSLYQALPELPIVGGAVAQLPARYETGVTKVPYGTEMTSVQEVYDLIVGYGAFLEKEGFVFDEFSTELNEILNWKFTGKEFLYWTTQNWADNSLITLSPFANYLKYSFPNSVTDNITSGKYEYSLLKADGKPYPVERVTTDREDTVCTIRTNDPNEGLFFATLNSVQKEHGMVFNNFTIFNDTIYDTPTGYKQRRIKLSGFRTKDWNGDLFSPGFVFDNVKITDWKSYENYLPGAVVRYNGKYYESLVRITADSTFDFTKWSQLANKPESQLLPNFDYKINQFEDFYSLDIDNFDYGQQQLAQRLIGYTPRTYLNSIFTNPISQYKFYQGLIKDKGTKNAVDKLSKASEFTNKGDITFKEEWAFRIGHYGSYETFKEIEFTLTEGSSLENPYVVKFDNSIPVDPNPLINYVTPADLLITSTDYNPAFTFSSYSGTWLDNNIKLTTAGYVRPDDITSTAYNKNSLLDIANNSIIKNGDTIWLGFQENGDWTVYRYINQLAKITGVFVSAPGSEITFVSDSHHGLQIGDIVSIVRFNEQVDGVYVVNNVTELNQFTVSSELASIENAELLNYGSLYKFEDARYSNLTDLSQVTDLLKLNAGDKVWIDEGPAGKWQVYEKVKNYLTTTIEPADSPMGQKFGYTIFATDDSPVMLVSSPSWRIDGAYSQGRVKVFNKVSDKWVSRYDYMLNNSQDVYCSPTSSTQFGYSLNYDLNKKLYFTGAPEATYVRAPLTTGTVILSTGSGVAKTFVNEGLVKINSRSEDFGVINVDLVLVNPNAGTELTANNSRFGHSIYIDRVEQTSATTVLVSAPGISTFAGVGSVYAYRLTTDTIDNLTTATLNIHPSGLRVVSTSSITLSNGSQWGYKIAGSNDGSLIAISAPGYSTSTGVVQLFDKNLKHIQTILSPFGENGKFGYDIALSASKQYLIISAPEIKNSIEPFGKVVIYSLTNNGAYELYQVVNNPLPGLDLKFGYSISISDDESTIAIGSLGKSRSKEQVYDSNSDVPSTTFDSGSTTFFESLPDAGTVYVYNKLGDYFVQADELNDVLIVPGSRYGSAVIATNDEIFVGAPTSQNNVGDTEDQSNLFIYGKKDKGSLSWKLLREQPDTTDISNITRVALIDTLNEEVIDYLDVIDPLKGKIAGIAEQELKYKAAFDPAVYSIGLAGAIVDTNINWMDEHVGELWWDLSTAKYMWYEQGDEIYRKNNWGRLFPGASIDIYEWVKSDLLPSEWAAQADTTEGLVNSISGQPKYPDNSIISVKQLFNNVTGSFENVYYYWVKNKVTLPAAKNRRLSGSQVASYIADPVASGLKFIEVLSPNAVAFANIQPSLISDRINANIAIDLNSVVPKHTEWLLLNEGDHTSVPNTLLEKKLFDSLIGHDSLGKKVPADGLTSRNRYGIGIRPQQGLFKDRLGALRNALTFVNSVLASNQVVGIYSFETLNKKEEIPNLQSYEYDLIVEDLDVLQEISTINYVKAEVTCHALNGKLRNIVIDNPGFGYLIAPKLTILSSSRIPAEVVTEIDAQGRVVSASIISAGDGYDDGILSSLVRPHSAIVEVNNLAGNRWTKHSFDYNLRVWTTAQTQEYNTPLYWSKIDWISDDYESYRTIAYTISDLFELGSLLSVEPGEYVKVKNIGDGNYAILKKVSSGGNYIPSYDIIYREQGTIQISDLLWNYNSGKVAYDAATIEETLYDQVPDQELLYILTALKNDIFVNDLKVNWNLLFFNAVKYALTEQKLLDWAFKTSFINVKNNIGTLNQRSVYKLNNEQYFEQYINEIKPYHTKIRSYTSAYDKTEQADIYTTDFDLPSYYNTLTDTLDVVQLGNPLLNTAPWKSWSENYKLYVGAIEVGYTGSGYTQRPTVTITTIPGDTGAGATAEAYIRNGSVYKVLVTNPGSGYTMPPTVTITGGGQVTDVARVSVIMANDNVRKNIIGMKFDRTSLNGDLIDLTVTDEFICDGTLDKFTLTWLASPDKKTITPLLDGKLIYGTDYTIEYYQTKVSDRYVDVDKSFPKGSWEGETMVDHRYRYFVNTNSVDDVVGSIRHYAKFVFLKQVPKDGQVFKITYRKSLDLYNAIDRINSLYNPTDDMPGKELPLLMSGAEYPGTSLQGLMFNQTPQWDSTGTQYDAAPWGDYISSYTTKKLKSDLYIGTQNFTVDSTDGIVVGQTVKVVGTSTVAHFKPGTVVTSIGFGNSVNIGTLGTEKTMIVHAVSTNTAKGSLVTLETSKLFHTAINKNDFIQINGIESLLGRGISLFVNVVNPPAVSTSTDIPLVGVTFSPPDFPGGIQATGVPMFDQNTATAVLVTNPGMGYRIAPSVTYTGPLLSSGSALAYLDPGYNQFAQVTTCTSNTLQFRTAYTLSSTATVLSPTAGFFLASQVVNEISASNKLIDHVTLVSSGTTSISVNTFAPRSNVVRAEVTLNSTQINSTSTDTLWYSISNSVDGYNRAIVTIRDTLTNTIINGDVDVKLYDNTELEFYTYNTDYNLDSVVDGSNLIDTSVGYKPEDIVIDGNTFLNAVDSYAPEECVPGHVRDSVGINVYTVSEPSAPLVISGAFAAINSGISSAKLSFVPDTPLGFLVYANGKSFTRVANQTSFSSSTQYCFYEGSIVVPAQPANTRIGYTYVTAGADVLFDSGYVSTDTEQSGNTGTAMVSSLLLIDDVRSVYVLVDGQEIPESLSPNLAEFGYKLVPTGSNNNRAGVFVQGLTTGQHDIEAWFFTSPYPTFNRVNDQFFTIETTATSSVILAPAPSLIEPASEQVIVEKITSTGRYRMLPPWASYYKVQNGQTTFAIDPKNSRPATYSLDNVRVYMNGNELRPGYDFTVSGINETVTLIYPLLATGDAIAIISLVDYDYIVQGDTLRFATPVANAIIKVTSFTNHDNMMIRTERFEGNYGRRFELTFPAISDTYVWVTVNSKPLIAGYDYKLSEDLKTIELSEFVDVGDDDDVVIVVVNPISYGDTVLGYRVFKDMFDRHHFHRLSREFTTRVTQPVEFTSDKILVEQGDNLLQPNPGLNIPGVVIIDGERIEYGARDGNQLSQLRRSTLGTGPARFSDEGTKVIDVSLRQKIATVDYSLVQHIASSNTTTYIINTSSNNSVFTINTTSNVGDGITLSAGVNAVDQVEVYFGGRRLRKTPLAVHDKNLAYYDSVDTVVIQPPEFSITTSTQEIILNIADEISTGTRITIVKKVGKLWTGTEATSLLSSTATQAGFLRARPAELPDIYYYGGDKVLVENSNALTDETGEPLEGY